MNIYASHECPVKSARYLDDKLVKDMAKETAKILMLALEGDDSEPCIKWAKKTRQNYLWLLAHFTALCDEYEARFDRPAKSKQLYDYLYQNQTLIRNGQRTPFVNQSQFSLIHDVHLAYRSDLAMKWLSYKNAPTWYKRAVDPAFSQEPKHDEETRSAA